MASATFFSKVHFSFLFVVSLVLPGTCFAQEPTDGQCFAVLNKILAVRDPNDSLGGRDAALYGINWDSFNAKKFNDEVANLSGRFCTTLNSTYKSALPCNEGEKKKEPLCQYYDVCKRKVASSNWKNCLETLNEETVIAFDPFIQKRYLVLRKDADQAIAQENEKKEKAALLAQQTRERVTNAEIKGIGLNTSKSQFLQMKSNARQIWKCEVLLPGIEECFGSTFSQGDCTPITVNGITGQACRSGQISQSEMSAELRKVSTIAGNLLRDLEVKFIDGRPARIQFTTTSQGSSNSNADEIVSLSEKFGPPLPIGEVGQKANSFYSTRTVSAWEGQDVHLTARRESSTGGAVIVLERPSLLRQIENRRQEAINKRNSEIEQERKKLSKDL